MKRLSWRERHRCFPGHGAVVWLFVALVSATPMAAAQDRRPSEDTQDPKPALPPPPPPPKPSRSFGDLLDQAPAATPQPPAAPAPAPVPPQATATGGAKDLELQIESLRSKLDAQRGVTLANITPLENLGLINEKAQDLRVLVDRMRSRIYLPDPNPEGQMATRLTALQARWGDLVRPLIEGSIPDAPVNAARWAGYAKTMSRQYCGNSVVRRTAPNTGMPLGGWTWACLSDLFFHELAEVEANVDHLLTARRIDMTAKLERLMTTAENRIEQAPAELAVHPSPQLLMRELTDLLHQVELEGVRLRIQELEYQKAAGSGTPAFRWLLETSPRVKRPSGGSSRTISAFSGSVVTATLGDASATATVVESALPRLARELHDAHFEIERLRQEQQDPAGEQRVRAEYARAHALAGMVSNARPPEPKK